MLYSGYVFFCDGVVGCCILVLFFSVMGWLVVGLWVLVMLLIDAVYDGDSSLLLPLMTIRSKYVQ